jgi:hypothetical protein
MALFSTAMEFEVFSPALPVVAVGDVVQLVSGFSLDGAVDCAATGPTLNEPKRTAIAIRIILVVSGDREVCFINSKGRTFGGHYGSAWS